MKPFGHLVAPVLALFEDRIDTDVLFPARFLLLMERQGLGRYLCHDRRFDGNEMPMPNPVDPAVAAGAGILLSAKDFGCGSSREQAVWALVDAGITCIIAESFGEIFAANCLRNGVLAIRMARPQIAALAALAGDGPLIVDLPLQRVGRAETWQSFEIAPASKQRLLNGWDEIDTIVARAEVDLINFEARQRLEQPWLYERTTNGRRA